MLCFVNPDIEKRQFRCHLWSVMALRFVEKSGHSVEKAMPQGARRVLQQMRRWGEEVYVVGGAVRDCMMGKQPKDWDLLTSMPVDEVAGRFTKARAIGKRHRIAVVPKGKFNIEISCFGNGKESYVEGNERLRLNRLRREAKRRDFTCNSLVYDPSRGTVLDFMGGCEDAQQGLLRCVRTPRESFEEDPARMLRAVRFASRGLLHPEKGMRRGMKEFAPLLNLCSQGRLHYEVSSMLGNGNGERSLALLWRFGLLDELMPGVAGLLSRHRVPRSPRKRIPTGPFHRLFAALDMQCQVWLTVAALLFFFFFFLYLLFPPFIFF